MKISHLLEDDQQPIIDSGVEARAYANLIVDAMEYVEVLLNEIEREFGIEYGGKGLQVNEDACTTDACALVVSGVWMFMTDDADEIHLIQETVQVRWDKHIRSAYNAGDWGDAVPATFPLASEPTRFGAESIDPGEARMSAYISIPKKVMGDYIHSIHATLDDRLT